MYEQKMIEQLETRSQADKYAVSAAVEIDSEGIIKNWNSAAETMFGWTLDEVAGRKVSETIFSLPLWDKIKSSVFQDLSNGSNDRFFPRLTIETNGKNITAQRVELTILPSSVNPQTEFTLLFQNVIREPETNQTLKAVNELARNLLGKTTLEEIAREITGKVTQLIGLENCVIYLLDDESGKLRQIAAYGEKNPDGRQIKNILEIELGEGVVGQAAQAGKPLIVNDCAAFEGYIRADYPGMSELAVPIIDNGVLLGVIDSEHAEKEFFSSKHLDIFTTIASLSAAQIRVAMETQRRIHAEKSLKESEERWQHLVENQPDALQITKNGKIEYLNPAGLRLYEAENMDQVRDLDLLELASEDVRETIIEQRKRLKRNGSAEPIEFTITTLKGNEQIIEANSTVIQSKEALVIQTILRDITEKKCKENELRNLSTLLRTLVDNINSGILMETPERKIMHTNHMFCDLFGNAFTPEDILGQDCAALVEPASQMFEDPETFSVQTHEVFEKSVPSLNEEWNTADGRVFERDFIPIWFDGEYLGSAWQYRDITDKKKVEQKLRKALKTERNYNELNKNLVSMVSHEFRTPLTSINSTAELLIQYADRFKGDEIIKRAERIYSSAQKMDSLIQDVLTIGKLESKNTSVDHHEFEFSEMLDGLIAVLRSTILKERDVVIHTESELETVYMDQNMMELILRNLLENAGKYSNAPEKIVLSYSITDRELNLSCQDFGIGIPEKDRELVFESFVRGSNTRDIKGTGLGLPIVKKSVERMGGSIRLDSEVGEGTNVSILIPINRTD